MLPPELQFELKPRRPLPWLKPAVVATCLLLVAGVLTWLVPRQRELRRLEEELGQAQQLMAQRPLPVSGPPPAWQSAAEQDGRLFALQLEPRLLEIERCTGPKVVVTRIAHDELAGATTLELSLSEVAELAPMLECFRTSDEIAHQWRLSHVEAMPAPSGTSSAVQRVVLKR